MGTLPRCHLIDDQIVMLRQRGVTVEIRVNRRQVVRLAVVLDSQLVIAINPKLQRAKIAGIVNQSLRKIMTRQGLPTLSNRRQKGFYGRCITR